MRLLVCGSRYWKPFDPIKRELKRLRPTVVIHGGAKGADSLAGIAARELGIMVEVYPAEWEVYGRSAGPIRNRKMLKEGKPDLVLAFHEDIKKSKGTADMMAIAKKAGIKVKLYKEKL